MKRSERPSVPERRDQSPRGARPAARPGAPDLCETNVSCPFTQEAVDVSAVMDEDGEPLLVYYGAGDDSNSFEAPTSSTVLPTRHTHPARIACSVTVCQCSCAVCEGGRTRAMARRIPSRGLRRRLFGVRSERTPTPSLLYSFAHAPCGPQHACGAGSGCALGAPVRIA